MSDKRTIIRHLIWLCVLALVVRLLYLWGAVETLGIDKFVRYADDTNKYLALADHLFDPSAYGEYVLFRVGPGYGLILAGIRAVFGSNLIFPILFSVLMGSLAAVAIYLLAYALFENKLISFLAGLIAALSHTSIALSTHILTDQPFFTIFAFALVCFAQGFKDGRVRWFLWAGVLASIATLIRPTGQVWPLIFLFLAVVVPRRKPFPSGFVQARRAAVTGLILLAVVLGWSARNHAKYGVFTFGSNGITTMRDATLARMYARHLPGEVKDFRDKWTSIDGDLVIPLGELYHNVTDRVKQGFRDHPDWLREVYFLSLGENIKTRDYLFERQIAPLRGVAVWLNDVTYAWFGWFLVITTLIGLGIMAWERRWLTFGLLGTVYFYFTLITGFSFWQGSRLHYPAEIAWSITVSFLVYKLGRRLLTRLRGDRLSGISPTFRL